MKQKVNTEKLPYWNEEICKDLPETLKEWNRKGELADQAVEAFVKNNDLPKPDKVIRIENTETRIGQWWVSTGDYEIYLKCHAYEERKPTTENTRSYTVSASQHKEVHQEDQTPFIKPKQSENTKAFGHCYISNYTNWQKPTPLRIYNYIRQYKKVKDEDYKSKQTDKRTKETRMEEKRTECPRKKPIAPPSLAAPNCNEWKITRLCKKLNCCSKVYQKIYQKLYPKAASELKRA